MVNINSYLSPKRIQIVEAENKNNALLKTLAMFENCSDIINYEQFCLDILNREALLSTGIGLGIGVPHVKNENIREPVAGLSVLRNPVDYGSMDGSKVSIVLLVGMPQNCEKLYLQYIAKISNRLSSAEIRRKIIGSESEQELYDIIQTL